MIRLKFRGYGQTTETAPSLYRLAVGSKVLLPAGCLVRVLTSFREGSGGAGWEITGTRWTPARLQADLRVQTLSDLLVRDVGDGNYGIESLATDRAVAIVELKPLENGTAADVETGQSYTISASVTIQGGKGDVDQTVFVPLELAPGSTVPTPVVPPPPPPPPPPPCPEGQARDAKGRCQPVQVVRAQERDRRTMTYWIVGGSVAAVAVVGIIVAVVVKRQRRRAVAG